MRTVLLRTILVAVVLMPLEGGTVPALLNQSGQIFDLSDNPLEGVETLSFTIYSSEVGSTALWSEVLPVTFDKGDYQVILGTQNPLEIDFFKDQILYMGISVGDEEEMIPRHQIRSVPYELKTPSLDKLDSDTLDIDTLKYVTEGGEQQQDKFSVEAGEYDSRLSEYLDGELLEAKLFDYALTENLGVLLSDYVDTTELDTMLSGYIIEDNLELYLSDAPYVAIGGELKAYNHTFILQQLSVDGQTRLDSAEIEKDLIVDGEVTVGADVIVEDSAVIQGDLTVGGEVKVVEDLTVTESVSVDGEIEVAEIRIDNRLLVFGTAELDALEVEQDVVINDTLLIGNSAIIVEDLAVDGLAEFERFTAVEAALMNRLTVEHNVEIHDNLNVSEEAKLAFLLVDESMDIENELTVGLTAKINGELSTGTAVTRGDTKVQGALSAEILASKSAYISEPVVDKIVISEGVKLGNGSDICNESLAGLVKWTGKDLVVCDGFRWYSLTGKQLNGLSRSSAGHSCLNILRTGQRKDGIYWIDPNGGSKTDAFKVFCDMTTDGGGWTLVMKIQSDSQDQFLSEAINLDNLYDISNTTLAAVSDEDYNLINPDQVWNICGGRQSIYLRNKEVSWSSNFGHSNSCSYDLDRWSGVKRIHKDDWYSSITHNGGCGGGHWGTHEWAVLSGIHAADKQNYGCYNPSNDNITTSPIKLKYSASGSHAGWSGNGFMLIR